MRLGDFKGKSEKINSTQRTIHLSSPPDHTGLKQKDLDSALESIISTVASSENLSSSAYARTENFQKELLNLTGKVNVQNIQIDKVMKVNASLLADNALLQKRLDLLTTLVEHGPMFSPGRIHNERESNGLVPHMVNLGTSEMSLFSVEKNGYDN